MAPKIDFIQQMYLQSSGGVNVGAYRSGQDIDVGNALRTQSCSSTSGGGGGGGGLNGVNSLTSTLAALDNSSSTSTTSAASSSADILNNINNAQDYASVSDSKAQIEAGREELTSSYNADVSSYIDGNIQSVLSELGISVPTLTPISGTTEKYEEDMASLSEDLGKMQALNSACETKLPEISEKKETAKARVSELTSQKLSLNMKIMAAKLTKSGRENLPSLRAELASVKEELEKAKEEYEKYKEQEKALKEGSAQATAKSEQIEKNKTDLTNYKDAEIAATDKTYEIAEAEDTKLEEQISQINQLRTEIDNLENQSETDTSESASEARMQKLGQLYTQYGALVVGLTNITTDLGKLINDNEGKTTVNNSEGASYDIKNYSEALKIVEEEKEKEEQNKKEATAGE